MNQGLIACHFGSKLMRQVQVRRKEIITVLASPENGWTLVFKTHLNITGQANNSYRELVGIWEGKIPRWAWTYLFSWSEEVALKGE